MKSAEFAALLEDFRAAVREAQGMGEDRLVAMLALPRSPAERAFREAVWRCRELGLVTMLHVIETERSRQK
jgi:hypothetical protein